MINNQSNDRETITGAQVRAGRALVRWSAEQLAKAAQLGVATVRRAESVDGMVNMTTSNAAAIRRALQSAGVEFIAENGGGPGVRLKFTRLDVKQIDRLENEGGPAREDDV